MGAGLATRAAGAVAAGSPGEPARLNTPPMKPVDRWRWRIWDDVLGKRRPTRWHMTEADALATDPGAERIDGSHQVLQLPETVDEHQLTSGWRDAKRQT